MCIIMHLTDKKDAVAFERAFLGLSNLGSRQTSNGVWTCRAIWA